MSQPGDSQPILSVAFYASAAGNEPAREWLLDLARDDRKAVSRDIKTAQERAASAVGKRLTVQLTA